MVFPIKSQQTSQRYGSLYVCCDHADTVPDSLCVRLERQACTDHMLCITVCTRKCYSPGGISASYFGLSKLSSGIDLLTKASVTCPGKILHVVRQLYISLLGK